MRSLCKIFGWAAWEVLARGRAGEAAAAATAAGCCRPDLAGRRRLMMPEALQLFAALQPALRARSLPVEPGAVQAAGLQVPAAGSGTQEVVAQSSKEQCCCNCTTTNSSQRQIFTDERSSTPTAARLGRAARRPPSSRFPQSAGPASRAMRAASCLPLQGCNEPLPRLASGGGGGAQGGGAGPGHLYICSLYRFLRSLPPFHLRVPIPPSPRR